MSMSCVDRASPWRALATDPDTMCDAGTVQRVDDHTEDLEHAHRSAVCRQLRVWERVDELTSPAISGPCQSSINNRTSSLSVAAG